MGAEWQQGSVQSKDVNIKAEENRGTGDYGEEVELGHQLCDSKKL